MSLSLAVSSTDFVYSSVGLPVHSWDANSIKANKNGTIGVRYLDLLTIFVEIHMSWDWPGRDLKLEKKGCALLYRDGIVIWIVLGAHRVLPVDFKTWSL